MVLTALDDESATFELGGQLRTVPIAAVSRYWFGDFLLLWRPPMAVAKALMPGMRGADVKWLRESLRTAQGLPASPAGGDVYDEDLTRLVQDFQRQHRLTVDGVAGVQTQIVLDTVHRRHRLADHRGPGRRRLTRMSFILDALRKSEHERQRQTGPALAEVPVAAPKPTQQRLGHRRRRAVARRTWSRSACC